MGHGATCLPCLESLEPRWALSSSSLIVAPQANATRTANMPSSSAANLIGLSDARSLYSYLGAGQTVALLDSGVDYRIPALGGGLRLPGARVLDGYDFVDGRGRSDIVEADDQPGPDADPLDASGHGTSVAGIIGGDSAKTQGIAPEVNFVALRVLDRQNQGDWSWISSALDWVIAKVDRYHITVVNLSLGVGNYQSVPPAPSIEPKLRQLADMGVTLVAAAGNNYFSHHGEPGLQYPAISPYVMSVGAVYAADVGSAPWTDGATNFVTGPDHVASFSQRSADLDLLAPGGAIASAAISATGDDRSATYSGTSQAAAFVTGASVLVRQALLDAGRSASPDVIRAVLTQTGTPVQDGAREVDNVPHTQLTFPRLDVAAALRSINPPPARIAPDRFESNESMDKAKSLGKPLGEEWSDLSWHQPGDVDWFRFQASSPGSVRIQISTPAMAPGASVTFRDVQKNKPRAVVAEVINGRAELTVDIRTGVNYFLEIKGPAGASSGYSLRIEPVVAGAGGAQSPTVDPFTGNNQLSKAAFLGAQTGRTISGLSLGGPSDVDWYRFQVEANGRIRIEIASELRGGVRFAFVDVSKNRERTIESTADGDVEFIEVDLRKGVNYFLRVEPTTSSAMTKKNEPTASSAMTKKTEPTTSSAMTKKNEPTASSAMTKKTEPTTSSAMTYSLTTRSTA